MSHYAKPWNHRFDMGPELPPPDWFKSGEEPQPDPPPDEDP